jgi:hypothetical protein
MHTRGMRTALVLLALIVQAPTADACDYSTDPQASVFQPASGKPAGRKPFIALFNVTGAVAVTQVAATCAEGTVCKGTAVAVDRSGNYLRPKAPLVDGARIQITAKGKLLADVTVAKGTAQPLPAWDGIKLKSAGEESEGLCSKAGPTMRLAVQPTKASLDAAVLLVYLEQPDPKQPLAKLAGIYGLGGGSGEITLNNRLGEKPWLSTVPKKIWVRLADGEGNAGPVIALP